MAVGNGAPSAHITIAPAGIGSQVVIDGHDIANRVTAITIEAKGGKFTTATVRLLGVNAEVDDCRIVLDDESTAALVALGWTPPAATP